MVMGLIPALGGAARAEWVLEERDGWHEVKEGGRVWLGWRSSPLEKPEGGDDFRGSAFFHPLRTPSGFEMTRISPADHFHHFGLWWPWKFVEVAGKSYNTWELQGGEGMQMAGPVKVLRSGADGVWWEAENDFRVADGGGGGKPALDGRVVIRERVSAGFSRPVPDTHRLDLRLRHRAMVEGVRIPAYRYSGFSWRGPAGWDRSNSRLLASGGEDRQQANGKPARWAMVSGETPGGKATLLILSAAERVAGRPERLRVWDASAHNGAPFVNFNPVVESSLPMAADEPAVADRRYRVLAVDRELDAGEADALWSSWMEELAPELGDAVEEVRKK